ncbi:MAG: proline racemase family protein [Armatimonadota bacterium]
MKTGDTRRVRIVDSHTGGEPTRLVIDGGPTLAGRGAAEMLRDFQTHHDAFRSAVVCEPRGSDVLVGGLLVEPADPACTAGIIFFNNVGYLGMCGHGTIGLLVTLAHLGRITPGTHRIETPVGVITAQLHNDGSVSVQNVPSYRLHKSVSVTLPGRQTVTGDVAWGGNWFFLCEDHGQNLAFADVEPLTDFAWEVRQALVAQGITGRDGAEIDHIELFGPPQGSSADSRSFVLCPGKAYDRSPCGTGTSAKLACLHADGKLKPGALWHQESIIGSVFTGAIAEVLDDGSIVPEIRGSAWVNSEATLLLDPKDPYCWGITG